MSFKDKDRTVLYLILGVVTGGFLGTVITDLFDPPIEINIISKCVVQGRVPVMDDTVLVAICRAALDTLEEAP